MKLYMSRMTYRMEMPKDVVLGNFQGAAELALAENIIKKMPDWRMTHSSATHEGGRPERSAGW